MIINVNKDNGKLIIAPEGRIDTITAPEFETVIDSNLEGVDDLVLDFKDVQYISSAGIRVILKTLKTMKNQGNMKLINVNDEVMEVFDITGFVDILNIE